MEVQALYDFTFSLTKAFEDAKDRYELIEGFKNALSLFFKIDELEIFLMDEYSFSLKDFLKPWENFSKNPNYSEIQKYFDNFLVQKSQYEICSNVLYFPIIQKHKTLGIVKLKAKQEIDKFSDFFKILPLVASLISITASSCFSA